MPFLPCVEPSPCQPCLDLTFAQAQLPRAFPLEWEVGCERKHGAYGGFLWLGSESLRWAGAGPSQLLLWQCRWVTRSVGPASCPPAPEALAAPSDQPCQELHGQRRTDLFPTPLLLLAQSRRGWGVWEGRRPDKWSPFPRLKRAQRSEVKSRSRVLRVAMLVDMETMPRPGLENKERI